MTNSNVFQKNIKKQTWSMNDFILGPGCYYQVETTIADVNIVSRINPEYVLGRPAIYLVVDVFSHMITGLYVGLEKPSWTGAMMALVNAASDKVSYCKAYDIDIQASEWIAKGLPDAILCGKGELISREAVILLLDLQVRIENIPSNNRDFKRILCKIDKLIQNNVQKLISKDYKKTDVNVYRFGVDLKQFTKIVIEAVLCYNNSLMKSYDRTSLMIKDDVQPIPKNIWEWGIANFSGSLLRVPEEKVKLSFMPVGDAKVTKRGIEFNGMIYRSAKALTESWFEKANEGKWTINISYDPRLVNQIYYRHSDGKNCDTCYLADVDSKYLDMSFAEVINKRGIVNETK
ncbi:Mu transposase C-terminal domain-containing protein [Paenibacillus sp. GCM10023248]|uniref:Mu transposase C-terminal domain-containing protein n=1 Tax=unclassified Paenibacillus TaxID=185978 RepID=UPI0023787FA9|nr:Mu transposase C-terminal domain-containing protein [Paenibacillus sp. MAHUQ-63]MDD9267869.1 Mu transposase C-terminal domain-containing protein [Paenibacillus sp. MAHUQ-63]